MKASIKDELNLGMIGAGRIAKFHLAALASVGLKVTNIAASRGSSNVYKFAEENNINNVWSDPSEMISKAKCDALVILAPTEPTLDLLISAMSFNIPILVEKPITHSSRDFERLDLKRNDVMVGYNRRYYPAVQDLKKTISVCNYVNLKVEIPETILEMNSKKRSKFYPVFQNSVHMLDLVQYLVGELKLESRLESQTTNSLSSISGLLSTKSGHTVNLLLNFNAPANYSIIVDAADSRYILCPIEEINHFRGMSVSEPTNERPFRLYSPKLISSVRSDPRESTIKPGFYSQALAFKNLINKVPDDNFATLSTSYNLIKLVEQILEVK